MTKVIIVHGKADDENDNPSGHWIPWLKEELSKSNTKTIIPSMPKPWKPNYESWKNEFNKIDINEKDILVGHSCGCAFIVRYLGENPTIKIKKLILVAPWKIPENKNEKEFYEYPIEKEIKNNIKEIIYFTSNNEEEDGKKSLIMFHKSIGGKIIKLNDHGHYTLSDMNDSKFPELLKNILK